VLFGRIAPYPRAMEPRIFLGSSGKQRKLVQR
jgi:hypothetical protein